MQSYIRALQEAASPTNATVIAAANGIEDCSCSLNVLAENGGHVDLGPGCMGKVFAHKNGLH